MSRPRIELRRASALAIAAAVLGGTLAGCSDLYYERRDTIAFGAGDAIAANEAEQTIDPWPRDSGDTAVAANGQRMQAAIERYRINKVTPPANIYNSAVQGFAGSQPGAASGAAASGAAAGASAGAAPASSTASAQ